MNKKTLVTYFSCSGNTANAGKLIAELTGGTLYEIKPQVAYSDADLDWRDSQSRSSREHADPSARPPFAGNLPDFAQVDVVYVGYPIWWGEAPRMVMTFLEAAASQLKGKTVVPFCTAHSSPLGQSDTLLHPAAPQANWQPGKCFKLTPPRADVQAWLKSIGAL